MLLLCSMYFILKCRVFLDCVDIFKKKKLRIFVSLKQKCDTKSFLFDQLDAAFDLICFRDDLILTLKS